MDTELQLAVGYIETFAGNGKARSTGDGKRAVKAGIPLPHHAALDKNERWFYFAESGSDRIRRIDLNGIITTVVGTGVQGFVDGDAAQAQLQFPFGMAMSPSARLYFADMTCQCWDPSAPGRLRVLNLSTGKISTVMDGLTPIQAV